MKRPEPPADDASLLEWEHYFTQTRAWMEARWERTCRWLALAGTAALLLALGLAAFWLLAGCATTTEQPPMALTRGPAIPNACLVDAIVCFDALKDSGAEPAIVGIHYRDGGDRDRDGREDEAGHAMTRYFWPPRRENKPWTRCYLFDRVNKSTDLPASISGDDPVALARWVMPAEVTKAWWLDPKEAAPAR